MSEEDLDTLATEYANETGLSQRVCRAFVKAEVEPPSRESVDRIGWTQEQRIIINKHFDFTPTEDF